MDKGQPVPAVVPERIIAHVAREYGITIADILGSYKGKPIFNARWEAIYRIARARPDLSLSDLGRLFNCHHTSIRYTVRNYAARNNLPIPARWQP
jgi:chromosomal replication initiation ATPase DnaA